MQQEKVIIPLPAGTSQKAAAVVALINGEDSTKRALVLETERDNLIALSDPTSPESIEALAAHLPVLEALFHRLAVDASACKYAAAKAALMRTALQAQNGYLRTVAVVSELRQQQYDRNCITLDSAPWE